MRKSLLIANFLFLIGTLFAQNNLPVPGACATGGGKGVSPLNGSATLGMTYNQSGCGLNFAVGNTLVETRFNGFTTAGNIGTGLPTTVGITGIPPCATILRAYVWYIVSYQTGPPATTVNFTNTAATLSNVPATNIGQDQSKCWGEIGSVTYRADVTANIAGSGNGTYGINITGLSNPSWEVDGVTLMIIYRDNGATYQGSMVIWDGNHTGVGNNYTQTMTGVNACGAGTNAKAFLLVSDMQDNVNGNAHPATLNGVTANYPNKFWCWDQANTTVTSGQASSNFGTDGLGSDCFTWAIMGLYYQTTTCTTCTPSAVSLTVTPTPSTCNAPNGSATATASGAPPPYTYTWSTGATTTSISNLTAGTYSVNVVDATGCSSSQTFTITTSMGPAVTFTATPSICNSTNGNATVTASGGTAPYTYGWVTTPIQTTPTATGLAAGTYSVLVGDASGCSATYTVNVTNTVNTFSVTPTQTNVMCFGNTNGSVTASPSGGTAPYSYAWSTNPIQTTPTVAGIPAGSYSVLVTDANGCTQTAVYTITQPPALTATASPVNNASCFGSSDGSVTAAGVGGTGTLSYAWTPTGQNTQTASGLPAGTYNVVVTDANGCTAPATTSITQPSQVALTSTSVAAACGISNGSATVTPGGGSGPYSFLWLTSPVQTTPTIGNLAAGTYNVLVTDANGCTSQIAVSVGGGVPPVANF